MNRQLCLKSLDVAGCAFAESDGFVFEEKLVGGLFECLSDLQNARMVLTSETQIPVFCELFGTSEAIFAGRLSPVLSL